MYEFPDSKKETKKLLILFSEKVSTCPRRRKPSTFTIYNANDMPFFLKINSCCPATLWEKNPKPNPEASSNTVKPKTHVFSSEIV
jgi:hypothetical protein